MESVRNVDRDMPRSTVTMLKRNGVSSGPMNLAAADQARWEVTRWTFETGQKTSTHEKPLKSWLCNIKGHVEAPDPELRCTG